MYHLPKLLVKDFKLLVLDLYGKTFKAVIVFDLYIKSCSTYCEVVVRGHFPPEFCKIPTETTNFIASCIDRVNLVKTSYQKFMAWKMFLSLHQPVTLNQIPNFFVMIFIVVEIQRKERQPGLLCFWTATATKIKTKKFGIWFLVFSHWCNKRNKSLDKYVT